MTLAETRRGGGILAVVTQSDLSRRLRIMAGGGGGLRNMLRWPWVTLAETRRGGGGGS